MEIQTRLKRGYVIRQIVIAVVSIVLGLWGIYDYAWTIPQRQEAHQRLAIFKSVVTLHETDPGDDTFDDKKAGVLAMVNAELEELAVQADHDESAPEVMPETEQEALEARVENLKKTIEELDAQGEFEWFKALVLFRQAAQTPRPGTTSSQSKLTGIHAAAWEVASEGAEAFADVDKPATYDRIVKGLIFVPCLPFGAWLLVAVALKSRKRYRLDSEGNLHLPGGDVWKRDEIADINMNKWMSKSIARPQHADGREVKLDDYLHQDMHLIVGALAHRFHPDQWHEDARKVRTEEDDEVVEEEGAFDEVEAGEDDLDRV